MKIEIRQARKQDFEFIYKMIKQLNGIPEEDEQLDRQKLAEIFDDHLEKPSKFCYVAEISEIAVGFMSFLFDEQLSEMGKVLTLEELVVDEAVRGQGVGTHLVHYATEFAKKSACEVMQTTTNFRRKETLQFYEKLGWNKNGYRFGFEL